VLALNTMHLIAQTPHFFIREFTPQDETAYMSLFDDGQVTLHLPKRTPQENRQMFRDTFKGYMEHKALGRWGIFNNGTEEFIGLCLLREYNERADQVELGYVLAQKFWGQGIAGAMAQIMVAYALTHTDVAEIVAVTTLTNVGSQKVLIKAGLDRLDNITRDGDELAFFSLKRPAVDTLSN
jgi:ribosomal-protein-alanine N-acetyltransferase